MAEQNASLFDWHEQEQFVKQCISKKKDLHVALEEEGLSFEDLQYREKNIVQQHKTDYKPIDKIPIRQNHVKVVSFFSGCGGLDLGFECAGFEHVVCIDNNEHFCNTLRENRPKWKIIGPPNEKGDVSDRETLYKELKKIIKPNFDGIFIGGPPCQPFSIAANQRFKKGDENYKRRGFDDATRGNLLFDYIWYIQKFKPKVFLIENVPGLRTVDGGLQLKKAIASLEKEGYHISKPTILNTADYGVPQVRKRLFIIGSKKSNFLFPSPSKQHVPAIAALEQPIEDVENHVTRQHNAESINRYMRLKPRERDTLGRVNRLDANRPSLTIIAGGMNGGGRSHLHPLIPRTLSVRESARLQTFPDDFVFYGPMARQFTQVGNAVPPLLAYHLAKAIAKQFFQT